MGRRTIKVELTVDERETLFMWTRAGKTERRMAQRAEVILLAGEGRSIAFISCRTRLSMPNCWKWRDRFRRQGLEGLKDKARSGRPSRLRDGPALAGDVISQSQTEGWQQSMEYTQAGGSNWSGEHHGSCDPERCGSETAQSRVLVRPEHRSGVRGETGGDFGIISGTTGQCPGAGGR